jgi:hypothetical protein
VCKNPDKKGPEAIGQRTLQCTRVQVYHIRNPLSSPEFLNFQDAATAGNGDEQPE